MPDAASRVPDVPSSTWDQMNVTVKDCLPCRLAVINSNVEACYLVTLFKDSLPRVIQQQVAGVHFRPTQVKVARGDSLGYSSNSRFAHLTYLGLILSGGWPWQTTALRSPTW
jgi:hypothetical protein